MDVYFLKTCFYILIVCWPCGCWLASCFWCVQKGFSISCYAFSKLFLKYYLGHFYHDFTLDVPKMVVLNLFGHDFNLLNGIFLPLTLSWPCLVFWLYFFFFFWLFKRYFMVYNTQDIVKLILYGYSLTGGGTTENKRWWQEWGDFGI